MSNAHSYGALPPQQGGYGAPPPQHGGYGAPPPQQHGAGYGQQQQGGYGGAPPQQHGGYAASPGGGYSRPPTYTAQTGPPPGADPQLWQWFIAVDRDGSGHISPTELSQALINGDWTPVDLDTCKLLLGIFDRDRSGFISFNEFSGLWKYIQDWQGVFNHHDADRSGAIEEHELANALSSFGYRLSPNLLRLLTSKYNSDAKPTSAPGGMQTGNRPAGITFDRFVRACVVVKTLTESFQRHDTQRTGVITLNYDAFMAICLSAP